MSPVLASLAAKAKAHHESLNAAYTTYYGGSTSTSPSASPATSPRPSMDSTTRRSSSVSKTWHAIKKAAKDHHEGLNAAYTTYYGAGTSSSVSRSASMSSGSSKSLHDVEDEEQQVVEKVERESGMKRAWGTLKEKAKEHHRSVEAAHGVYYSRV